MVCYSSGYSLLVFKTSLHSLGLVSLQSVENGKVMVKNNARLCYLDKLPWPRILHLSADLTSSLLVKGNMADDECGKCSSPCSSLCSQHCKALDSRSAKPHSCCRPFYTRVTCVQCINGYVVMS